MARPVVASIEGEYRRAKRIGEGALGQLTDEQLRRPVAAGTSSPATVAWHLCGNLISRFTDFLQADGEKPWRDRESEFLPREVKGPELIRRWEEAWRVLFAALSELDDGQLHARVSIRGVSLAVHEALHRSLAHTSYHVGQIVALARAHRGERWEFLSIPPGGTAAYNRDPTAERPPGT